MTTQVSIPQVSLPAQLRRTAVLTWLELPHLIAVGLVGVVLALPVLTGLLGAPWPLVALGALPSCLYAAGVARYAAAVARGERPRVREAFHLDLVLGCSIEAGIFVTGALLVGGGVLIVPGVVLAAVLLLVAPFALAYGAVRGRTGFTAWRGGFILVAYRPGAALSLLALNCIAAFAVIASLGVFGVILPCYLFVFASAVVAGQLDDIDHRTGMK